MQPSLHPLAQPAYPRPVRFGGPLDAASNLIGVIDSNRIIELLSTDIIGMCLPRTAIEAQKRGPDAARETAIRELGGLVGNIFLVGWFSKLFLKALGNRVNSYNPHGIPAKAWLNIETMKAFGTLYEEILNDPKIKTPEQARARLVHDVLSGLQAADKKLGGNALTDAAKVLEGEVKARYLKEIETHAAQGRLPQDVLKRLISYYELRDPKATADVVGTTNFNLKARQMVDAAERRHARSGAAEAFDAAREFIRTRMRLGMDELRSADKEFTRVVDQEALSGYLSKQVNLHAPDGRLLAADKGRDTILRELKHFLEQYVDRAADGAKGAGWQERVMQKLVGRSENKSFLARFIPQFDDGLLEAARKSKWAYSWIPVFMAVLGSISVAFYNNWLTRKRLGGTNVSPFELGLAQKMGAADQLLGKPGNLAAPEAVAPQRSAPGLGVSAMPAVSGLRRPQGAFTQFQVARQPGGFTA